MDRMSTKKRSYTMSKIRSKNTVIERQIFGELKRRGIIFQRHCKDITGCPDVVVRASGLAVFIDGDFWHGWRFSKVKHKLPATYWRKKIASNVKRDIKIRKKLAAEGWKVIRIWEHQIKNDLVGAVNKIIKLTKND